MNRRSFLESTLGVGVCALCATRTEGQSTIDSALERYTRLQAASLKSRKVDYTERDVRLTSLELRAHVIEVGGGEPLLLIHGGNGVGAHWLPLMARLSGRRLVVPDRPGCGLSDGFLYDGVDMRTHGAAFVESLLDALKIDQASIIGNSMGGYYALCFALAHPQRLRRLILAGGPAGSAGFRPVSAEVMAAAIETRVRSGRQPGRAAFDPLVADPGRIPDDLVELFGAGLAIAGSEESWRSILRSTRPDRTTFSLHSELEGMRTPTLLIWGEQDRIDPPVPAATALAQHLPNARLVLLPDAGHMPWFDNPDECARLVTEFLA